MPSACWAGNTVHERLGIAWRFTMAGKDVWRSSKHQTETRLRPNHALGRVHIRPSLLPTTLLITRHGFRLPVDAAAGD